MSKREMIRAAVLAQVESGAWTLVQAAEQMELSYRQAKRLWKRYSKYGGAAVVHGNAGRASNRAKPKKVRAKVVRLIRQKYSGEVGQRFRANAGGRALGERRPDRDLGHHGAALDVDRGAVEPREKSAGASAKKSPA